MHQPGRRPLRTAPCTIVILGAEGLSTIDVAACARTTKSSIEDLDAALTVLVAAPDSAFETRHPYA